MRKYFAVAKTLFKAQIIYRFDVAMTALETIGRVLFAWLVWGAVFEGHTVIGGFRLDEMLMYYVISSFLSSLDKSWGVSEEVSYRIRGGTFSKFMVIPANPQAHFLAQTFGTAVFYALFAFPVAVFSGFIFGAGGNVGQTLNLLLGIVMIPLGMIFMVTYHYLIGLMAFKFQDVGFFRHFQGMLVQFAQGGLLPLSLLPVMALKILQLLPFSHVVYTPVMLLIGRMDLREGLFSLCVMVVWTSIILVVVNLTYNRLRNKYDGVGI